MKGSSIALCIVHCACNDQAIHSHTTDIKQSKGAGMITHTSLTMRGMVAKRKKERES